MPDPIRAIVAEPDAEPGTSGRTGDPSGPAAGFDRSWAKAEGGGRPADVRAEHDAAVHLLLRMISLATLRVASLLTLDVAALMGAAGVAHLVAPALRLRPLGDPAAVGVVLGYGILLGLAAMGAYSAGDPRRDSARLASGVLLGCAGTALLTRMLDLGPAPLPVLGFLTLLCILFVVVGRLGIDAVTRSVSLRGWLQRRVLLVGDSGSAEAVLAHFNGSVHSRLRVAGRLCPGSVPDAESDGGLGRLQAFLEAHAVDVVLVTTQLPEDELRGVVTGAFRRGVRVELVPTAVRDTEWMVRPQILFGCPVLEMRPSRLGVPQMALKRALDLALASTLLLILLPLFVLIAVAIRVDTKGPILFRQTRAGLGGRPFTILKFRTMSPDAERAKSEYGHLNGSGDPRLFKIAADPRVTRVGRVLRALSLDELPQLFNIVRGDMSFVGPRPFFREDFELYEPHHFERLAVLPGLTGLWQVSGRSEIVDFESVVRLDQEYIRNWSLLLDLRIMLKTLPALIRGHGAF